MDKIPGIVFQALPGGYKLAMRNQFLNGSDIGIAQLEGQKVHDGRCSIDGNVEFCHRRASLQKMCQLGIVSLGDRPLGTENFEPASGFQGLHHGDWIFFVSNLLQFVPDGAVPYELDVIPFNCRIVTGAGPLFQFPAKACGKAAGAKQTRRVLKEGIAVQNTYQLGFDVGCAVEWIEQEAARALVETRAPWR